MFKDGYLDVPEKPGLGIEIDEEPCKESVSRRTRLD